MQKWTGLCHASQSGLSVNMKKIFTLLLGMALTSSLSAQSIKMLSFGMGVPGIDEPQMMALGISPNGKYVSGALFEGGYFIYDLENGVSKFEMSDDPEGAELRHVDNFGLAIGFNGPGITYSIEGVETVLPTPSDEYKYILGESLSDDGGVMVGSLVAKGYVTHAAYSKDGGDWTLLPLPDDSVLGEYAGTASSAKYVSGDGKVIVGYVGIFGPGVIWVANDKGEYEVDPLYAKYMAGGEAASEEEPLLGFSPMGISDNGKFVLFQGVVMRDEQVVSVPVVYEVESKSITVYSEPQEIDSIGMGLLSTAIADDGTMIGIIGSMPMMASAGSFIWKAGEAQATSLCAAFPVYEETFGMADSIGYCVPVGISADGQYILGYGFYSDDFYDEAAPAYLTSYVIDCKKGSGVECVSPAVVPAGEQIFSIDGMRRDRLSKGINIVRLPDGSTRKILK